MFNFEITAPDGYKSAWYELGRLSNLEEVIEVWVQSSDPWIIDLGTGNVASERIINEDVLYVPDKEVFFIRYRNSQFPTRFSMRAKSSVTGAILHVKVNHV